MFHPKGYPVHPIAAWSLWERLLAATDRTVDGAVIAAESRSHNLALMDFPGLILRNLCNLVNYQPFG